MTNPDPLPPDGGYRLGLIMACLLATIVLVAGGVVGAALVFILINYC